MTKRLITVLVVAMISLTAAFAKDFGDVYWSITEDSGKWVGSEFVETVCSWEDLDFSGMVADGREQINTGKVDFVFSDKTAPKPSKDVLSRVSYFHCFVAYVNPTGNVAFVYEFDTGRVFKQSFCVKID